MLGLSSGSTTQFKFLKAKANSFLLCSVCSSFIFVHIEEGLDGVSDNWQMAKILTPDTVTNSLKFNWQLAFALGFTDNWQRTWLSLIFYKTRFKALNSIVLLFSSDNVIKCAFWGVILAARPLSVIFRWWFTIKPMSCTICGKNEKLLHLNDNWQMAKILTDNWHLYRLIQTLIESPGVLLPS